MDAEQLEFLYGFGENFSEKAANNLLDPCIGREEELAQVIETLSRRRKNNPMLVGEPGVGKTAIVEGLAQRIYEGNVPEHLREKTVFMIDLSAITAKGKNQGEFEETLKKILGIIRDARGEILPFIDEIHMILSAKGTLNASDIIKPMLARGELHLIGATTFDEYHDYIETDPALERRFQVVQVDEPDVESTIPMLAQIKEKYELYHRVRVDDSALRAAAQLAERYIQNRRMPDKAIDLLDIACARLSIAHSSESPLVRDLKKKIMAEEITLEKLQATDTSEFRENRIEFTNKNLAALRKKLALVEAKTKEERDILRKMHGVREKMAACREARKRGEFEGRSQDVVSVTTRLAELEKEMQALDQQLEKTKIGGAYPLKPAVDDASIAEVVHRWTGIPVTNLLASEKSLLLKLDASLKKHIIGQDKAIDLIAGMVRRSRTGMHSPVKPRGSALLLGASGVGKTTMAEIMALVLFHDREAIVRIDLNEYQEKSSLRRLIGSADSGQEGILLSSVKRKPYSIVLFEGIEKADLSVQDVILEILDNGVLTDPRGRKISFRNTYVIMTSNTKILVNEESENFDSRDNLYRHLIRPFRSEMINKIDELIWMRTLTQENLYEIAKLQMQAIIDQLAEERNCKLTVTDEAYRLLAEMGYNPEYGVRELERVIKNEVKTKLANFIISDKLPNGSEILLDVKQPETTEKTIGNVFKTVSTAKPILVFKIKTA